MKKRHIGLLAVCVFAAGVVAALVFWATFPTDTMEPEPVMSSTPKQPAEPVEPEHASNEAWRQEFYDIAIEAIARSKEYPVTSITLYEDEVPVLMKVRHNHYSEIWKYSDGPRLMYEGDGTPVGYTASGNLVVRQSSQNAETAAWDAQIVELTDSGEKVLAERGGYGDIWTLLETGETVAIDYSTPDDNLVTAGLYTALPWADGYSVLSGEWWDGHPAEADPDPSGILKEIFGLQSYKAEGAPEWLNSLMGAMRQEMYVPFLPEESTYTYTSGEIPLYYVQPNTQDASPVLIWNTGHVGSYGFVTENGVEVQSDYGESIYTFYTAGNGESIVCYGTYGIKIWSRFGRAGLEELVVAEYPMGADDEETVTVSVQANGHTQEYEIQYKQTSEVLNDKVMEALAQMDIGELEELEWVNITPQEPASWKDVETALLQEFVS